MTLAHAAPGGAVVGERVRWGRFGRTGVMGPGHRVRAISRRGVVARHRSPAIAGRTHADDLCVIPDNPEVKGNLFTMYLQLL